MRVSEYFQLGRTQGSLDFVDVDEAADVRVFIDPRAIRSLPGEWGRACAGLLASFFTEVLEAIGGQNIEKLRYLLGALREPNETHMGFSKGARSRGRGLGPEGSEDFAEALALSLAARKGLLQNIDDALLMVAGVGPDIVSDVTTHVIRGALIGYTQAWAEYYDIPLERQWSGPVWNPNSLEWQEGDEYLPRTSAGKLLLVPRSIVRWKMTSDKDQYYNGYLAPLLEQREIDHRTRIVNERRNGSLFVYRDDLKEKYPADKLAIVRYSIEFPEALKRYRDANSLSLRPLMDHPDFSERLDVPNPDYEDLLGAIKAVNPGRHGAKAYHDAVEALLTALFYPSLTNPQIEKPIHEGRKRIDITYDNMAQVGFFRWVANHHPASIIPVECKNYAADPENPELDQLAGRFSQNRGIVGLLVVRSLAERALFMQRCRDTAQDGRGFIIALDDEDLESMCAQAAVNMTAPLDERHSFKLLRDRFDFLI